MDYDFHVCKVCSSPAGRPLYELSNAIVWVCSDCGLHYTNYLDPVSSIEPHVHSEALTPDVAGYIEKSLQSNDRRFRNQVDFVRKLRKPEGLKVLDVGCGGGLFLSLLEREGADVWGIDLDDARVEYARTKHNLTVHKVPIEDAFWQSGFREAFDLVTFWDVIEHVNFPLATLRAAANLLNPDGLLLLDTPCRDTFYHRFGSMSYRLSRGKRPMFLNAMYSNHLFGHKQILSINDIYKIFILSELELISVDVIHELSFPYRYYLRKLLKSALLVEVANPLVTFFFKLIKIRNKMIVAGRKRAQR